VFVAKVNSDGSVEWQKRYDGGSAHSVEETDDGYIVGAEHGAYGSWVIKLTKNGNIEWEKTYGAAAIRDITTTSDGSFLFTGAKTRLSNQNASTVKLNPNGTIAWQKFFGGSEEEYSCCVEETPDGGVFVLGRTDSFGQGIFTDIWAVKLSANGSILWQKSYGGVKEEVPYSICILPNGYIISGDTYSYGVGERDFWILNLDENGICPSIDQITSASSEDTSETASDTNATIEDTTFSGIITNATITSTDAIVQQQSP
jgi:hypothetical protein